MATNQFTTATVIRFILTIVLTIASASFASAEHIILTIHTVPEGAALFINTTHMSMGTTPVAIKYQPRGKCQNTQPIEVRWASGATATLPALSLCWKQGNQQTYTFTRPAGISGVETDLEVSAQRMATVQAQIENAQRQAEINALQRAATWNAVAAGLNSFTVGFQQGFYQYYRPSIYCNSTRIGRQTFTSCY